MNKDKDGLEHQQVGDSSVIDLNSAGFARPESACRSVYDFEHAPFARDASRTAVQLDGEPFDFEMIARIGAGKAVLSADPTGIERCRDGRLAIERRIAMGLPVYGSTTGVGAMKNVNWSADDLASFNCGLVQAHHFGTGAPFPLSVVRNAIAIRINTALTGRVGCTVALVDAFLHLMAADVVPVVRRSGSIGCADIGLMGQIGAVLTGVGEAVYRGRRLPADIALQQAGLSPFTMAPRDSLASISVNAISFASAADAVRSAAGAVRTLLAVSVASSGAMGASPDPWKAAIHVGTDNEALVGSWLCQSGRQWVWPVSTHVQDPLSLRMMPQVFGTCFESLLLAGRAVLAATGRTDDNPVTVEGEVLSSGGSLPLGVTVFLQAASITLAHVARNSFNRCVLLCNGGRRDLPINLVPANAVVTGFGPVVKSAGELFSRVLSVSAPVSAQSLVMAGGLEDEATFLPLVVERFEQQVEAIRRLTALEAFLATQAIDLLGDRPAGVARIIYEAVRTHADFYSVDRPLSVEVERVDEHLAADYTTAKLFSEARMTGVDTFFSLAPV